jgi:hypothetical protein
VLCIAFALTAAANYLIDRIYCFLSKRSLVTKRPLGRAGNFCANRKYPLGNNPLRCSMLHHSRALRRQRQRAFHFPGSALWHRRLGNTHEGPRRGTFARFHVLTRVHTRHSRGDSRDDSRRFCVGRGFTVRAAAGLLTRARHRRNCERALLSRLSPRL